MENRVGVTHEISTDETFVYIIKYNNEVMFYVDDINTAKKCMESIAHTEIKRVQNEWNTFTLERNQDGTQLVVKQQNKGRLFNGYPYEIIRLETVTLAKGYFVPIPPKYVTPSKYVDRQREVKDEQSTTASVETLTEAVQEQKSEEMLNQQPDNASSESQLEIIIDDGVRDTKTFTIKEEVIDNKSASVSSENTVSNSDDLALLKKKSISRS